MKTPQLITPTQESLRFINALRAKFRRPLLPDPPEPTAPSAQDPIHTQPYLGDYLRRRRS